MLQVTDIISNNIRYGLNINTNEKENMNEEEMNKDKRIITLTWAKR